MAITGIKTAAGYELRAVMDYDGGVSYDPDPRTCQYQHFDLSTEQLGRTRRYNCWGFTFLPRRYWINSSSDVDHILADNCVPVSDGSVQPGDVIRYRDDSGITTHTGRVWKVDDSGHCTQVRSKWGGMAEYIHDPLTPDITPVYGTNLAYFRQVAPLRGVGDLWVKDSPQDNGEQCSSYLWTSPYIMLDAPPYGSPDNTAIRGADNRVSVMVENRSDNAIENVRARYYWANPSVGFAPSNWNLIESTSGHPNPTATFSVPAYSTVEAPYVVWTPTLSQAHQCLLAVVYVNDDPTDSSNPDPLVYPFDIRWDNNIAARNVTVVSLKLGEIKKYELVVVNPHERLEEVNSSLRYRLTVPPRLPLIGFPRRVVTPRVALALDGRSLQPLAVGPEPIRLFEREWGPHALRRDIDFELSRVRPLIMSELLRLNEKTVAWKEEHSVELRRDRPRTLTVELAAPEGAHEGSSFYLHVEQVVEGEVTGGYTFAITIVP